MEKREDLKSILPFLPLFLRSSSLFWPSKALEALRALALGPDVSRVDAGDVLFDAILDLRDSLGLSSQRLASRAADGYALFFDELMSREGSRAWFGEVVPGLARLLLRLPSLFEAHYAKSDELFGEGKQGLRIMHQQESGIVFLSQELVAALLACAFFCLFPTSGRGVRHLPYINFDHLFATIEAEQSQEQKVKCIVHYFERICSTLPSGYVSFERKILPLEDGNMEIMYPQASFWSKSSFGLCSFEVITSGLIEDQPYEALEVDFANKYLGGGALTGGCVQEEIRFMLNPELIAGMLFMPSMKDNEAIEIVGSERFSCYMGYGSSFRFLGDYMDNKDFDSLGRRQTRIIAIDALVSPGMRQYEVGRLIRETNKALCGFSNQSKFQSNLKNQGSLVSKKYVSNKDSEGPMATSQIPPVHENSLKEVMGPENSQIHSMSKPDLVENSYIKSSQAEIPQETVGVATGNWGCGAFGGDPEIKSMIQWLAASQASRPFIHYYTFGQASLCRLEEGWTVGDLWNMLVEYSTQRLTGETNSGFFFWLLPYDSMESNSQHMHE